MKKIFCITALAALLGGSVSAQQLPLSSLYNVNKFQNNSAYAGFSDCLEGYLSHRAQWVGVDGSPTTNYLSIHSGVAKNMGLGANLVYDQTDIISKFSGSLSYAYRVKLGMEHNLRFGLSGGIYQVSTKTSNALVEDNSDFVVAGGNQSSMAFKNDFSVYYNYKKLEIGISIPQILETEAKFDVSSAEGGFSQSRHIVGYIGYDIPLSEKFSIEPSAFYRSANGKQSQADINAQLNYKQAFFVGAGYRTSGGLLARLGMNLKEMFVVAYVYEFTNNNVSSYSSGSHEIMLGLKFCKGQKEEIVKVEPAPVPVVVPDPVVEVVVPDSVVEPEPVAEVQKIFDVAGANAEFNKRENIIRYEKNVSNKTNSANETRLVNKVVEVLTNNSDLKVKVSGHTCDIGSSKLNQELSENRAKKIEKMIVAAGIDQSRVTSVGKGETSPLKPNTSEANRIENRRVQLSFSKSLR